MSYSYEKISGNQIRFNFEIPAEQFDEATRKVFLSVRKSINVPGFRRGKAPRVVVEQMYGKEIFYEDALEDIYKEECTKALDELKDETIVDQVHLEKVEQIGQGQDLKFSATVYVMPEVTLGEYKGLEVEVPLQKLTDEMVDAQIEQDRSKVSRAVEVEGRPAQNGDTVNIDYVGTVDGVPFEGGSAEDQELELGSGKFIPGFEEQVVGMNTGDEKDIEVTFPDPYTDSTLAGKDAVFHVTVNAILSTEKPELDDEFAKDVSDFNTFEEYKADVVKKLTERIEKNNRGMTQDALVDKAAENASLEIPPVLIDNEVERRIRDMSHSLQAQNMTLETYLGYFGMKVDDLRRNYRADAEKQVRGNLVLDAIRKAENIECDEESFEAYIKEAAEARGEDAEDLKNRLTEDQKKDIEYETAMRKTLDFLAENAKVTEKKPIITEKTEEAPAEEAATAEKTEEAPAEEPKAGKAEKE